MPLESSSIRYLHILVDEGPNFATDSHKIPLLQALSQSYEHRILNSLAIKPLVIPGIPSYTAKFWTWSSTPRGSAVVPRGAQSAPRCPPRGATYLRLSTHVSFRRRCPGPPLKGTPNSTGNQIRRKMIRKRYKCSLVGRNRRLAINPLLINLKKK